MHSKPRLGSGDGTSGFRECMNVISQLVKALNGTGDLVEISVIGTKTIIVPPTVAKTLECGQVSMLTLELNTRLNPFRSILLWTQDQQFECILMSRLDL